MNTKRHAISLSLALALGVSAGVQASQANHENDWSNVVSYGDTTIAHDSPEDFGPWKMMVQPAAGPTGTQPPAATTIRTLALMPTSAPIPKPTTIVSHPLTPATGTTSPAATPPVIFAAVTSNVVITPPPPPPPAVTPPPPPTPAGIPTSGSRGR